MAGGTADKSKHIFQVYFMVVFGVCSGAFVSAPYKAPRFTDKIDPTLAPFGEIHQQCKNLYRVQNKLEAGDSIPHNFVLNCSYREDQSFPLDLTTDGYLRIDAGNYTSLYYPPSQFCISTSRKSARLCQSQYPPTVWRKCCPEHHRLSGVTPKTCVNSPVPFRPNISGHPHSFIVKANSTFGSRMTPLPCPLGYRLKKLSTKGCSSRSMTRKALAAISSLFWNADDDETFPPCNHCSFELYSNGTISYQEPTGVFIRKSEWKTIYPEEDHYCIDGLTTSHSTSDCNNGQFDPGCGDDEGKGEQYDQMSASSSAVLYICIQNDESFEETNDASATAKTTLLAVIWVLTCPLLFGAALGNSLMIQRNVHGWVLTCYLLSMCLLNIISVLFILDVGRAEREHGDEKDGHEYGGCRTIDFAVKFTYMSTLCWMTSINFGLWKTFRYTLPEPGGIRRFMMSVLFSLGFPLISVTVSYYMATLGSDHNCKSEYCLLFSYNTIPFYQVPISLMVLLNLAIFIKTTCTIASLRKDAAEILQVQAQDHLKSFALFTKLFLLTGAIWLIRLVLFVLQIHGLYLSWYGVVLEGIFSLPEIVFPIIVFHHPEFIKWSWERAPRISRFIHAFNPLFKAADSKKSVSSQS